MKMLWPRVQPGDDGNRPNGYLHCWTEVQMLGHCISFLIVIIYIAE